MHDILQFMKDAGVWLAGLNRGGDSHTGRLLDRLIRTGAPQSLAALARATGLSESKVLREANRLQDAGLLVESRAGRARLVSVNAEHPLYRPIAQALYLTMGTTAPQTAPLRPSESKLLPDVHKDLFDGPSLMIARARAEHLSERLLCTIRAVDSAARNAYNRWHNERDREIIHRMIQLGDGVLAARRILVSSADHAQYVEGLDRVGRHAWAYATDQVRAEADAIENAITRWAIASADQRKLIDKEYRALAEAEQMLGNAHHFAGDEGEPVSADLTEELQQRIRDVRADILRAEDAARPLGRLSTQPYEIGTAGERLLAGTFDAIAEALRAQADEMDDEAATALSPDAPLP